MDDIKNLENNLEILEIHARTHKPVQHITGGAKYEVQLLYEILESVRKILNKIKNGTLIAIPFKIGDMVYTNCRYFEEKEDVVPVVRCKDCVFWDTESIGFSDEHICKMHSIVEVHSRYTNPTDYCSYGERRGSG